MNFDITESELRQIFGSFGEIKHLSMIPDYETGKHKGYGFIDFDRSEAAQLVRGHWRECLRAKCVHAYMHVCACHACMQMCVRAQKRGLYSRRRMTCSFALVRHAHSPWYDSVSDLGSNGFSCWCVYAGIRPRCHCVYLCMHVYTCLHMPIHVDTHGYHTYK